MTGASAVGGCANWIAPSAGNHFRQQPRNRTGRVKLSRNVIQVSD